MRRVYRDDTGKRHWVRGETEQELADKIASIKEAVKRGEDRLDGKMLVSAWAKTWLEQYIDPKAREPGEAKKRGTMTAQSCRMYHAKLDGYILPAIGKLRMAEVKDVHLQRLLNAQAKMSDSHVKKCRIVLEAMFRQAYKSRIIAWNPAEDLTLPAADAGKRRSLTDYEREILLQVAATHKHGLWIRFLLATGIRPGESAPLQARDLLFDGPQPRVLIYKDIEGGTNDKVSAPKTAVRTNRANPGRFGGGAENSREGKEAGRLCIPGSGRGKHGDGQRHREPVEELPLCDGSCDGCGAHASRSHLRPCGSAAERETQIPRSTESETAPGRSPDSPGPLSLLPAPHVLHRPPAEGRPAQHCEVPHGPHQHLSDKPDLHPPGRGRSDRSR